MSIKYFGILIGFLIFTELTSAGPPSTECGKSYSHNFFIGLRESGDREVLSKVVFHKSSFMRKYSEDLEWPKMSNVHEKITRVEAWDQNKDGYGGCVSVRKGGVGSNKVSLHIKSGVRGYGYNFIVKIFAVDNSRIIQPSYNASYPVYPQQYPRQPYPNVYPQPYPQQYPQPQYPITG